MRVISKNPQFPAFWTLHPDAQNALMGWYRKTRRAVWKNFADVRLTFGDASIYKQFVIFNIGGGKYRLITRIAYEKRKVYIRQVLTHKEYNLDEWKTK